MATELSRFSTNPKKIHKQTERRIASGREDFQTYLDDINVEEASERDFELARGGLRRSADAALGENLRNISSRTDGDTSSSQFQMLATGAYGTSRAAPDAALANLRFEQSGRNAEVGLQKANLALALRGLELNERGAATDRIQNLEAQQIDARNFTEQQRQFDQSLRASLTSPGQSVSDRLETVATGTAPTYRFALGTNTGVGPTRVVRA